MRFVFLAPVLAVIGAAACESAVSLPADVGGAGTLTARLAGLRGGETIRLAPGDYGSVIFPQRMFSPAITIDATGATFTGLVLNRTGGVTIRNGEIRGPGGKSYGIGIRGSERVRIEGMRIGGARRGVVVNESSDIDLVGNELAGLQSDGINVALSRRVRVQRNHCHDFSPRPSVFDAAGKKLRDGDHPDCIQGWSRPTAAPTADVLVEDNRASGKMQGIFFGDGVHGGVPDGGFDRITIRNNRVEIGFTAGIVLANARDSLVTGNTVRSIKGSYLRNDPRRRVKANVLVNGERTVACGNVAPDIPQSPVNARCRS